MDIAATASETARGIVHSMLISTALALHCLSTTTKPM
jgi:hypothetical protein